MKTPWRKRAEEAEERIREAEAQGRAVERQQRRSRVEVRRAETHYELNGWNKIARALIDGGTS